MKDRGNNRWNFDSVCTPKDRFVVEFPNGHPRLHDYKLVISPALEHNTGTFE